MILLLSYSTNYLIPKLVARWHFSTKLCHQVATLASSKFGHPNATYCQLKKKFGS